MTDSRRVGTGRTYDALSFSMYAQLQVHVQMGNVQIPKREEGRHSLTDLSTWKKGAHIPQGAPTETHHISPQRLTLYFLTSEWGTCFNVWLNKIRKRGGPARGQGGWKSQLTRNNQSHIRQSWERSIEVRKPACQINSSLARPP